ncbi:MAG: response regulator [Pseudomonadota bacterium]
MYLQNQLKKISFLYQLTVIFTVAIVSLALFSAVMTSEKANQTMQSYILGQGLRITESLAKQSALALVYGSGENAREVVATTLSFPDVVEVEILDNSQKTLLLQNKLKKNSTHKHIPPPVPKNFTHSKLVSETEEIWRFGAPVFADRAESSPFEMEERKSELLGYVFVSLGKSTLKDLVRSLFTGNVIITVSFAVGLLFVMRLLVLRITQPLQTLSHLMQRAESGESGIRAKQEGPKEIIEMSLAFNQMMYVLEEREQELTYSRDVALRLAKVKTQFAATVSHELRTPLNGVVGMLDMLRETPLKKRQQECLDVAWRSAYSLVELINDILDFSKMEAGKLNLEEIEFELSKTIEDVLELLGQQAQQKHLELGYCISPEIASSIKSDPMRLRQLLLNLIGNALKFTLVGEVALRVNIIKQDSKAFLRFEVSDTGIGMNQHAAAHIFESFAQADNSTTRKFGGTGLGLAISKQIVDLMGGEIGVISEVDKGAVFWFTMPYIACQSSVAPLQLPDTRIMLVEDSLILRDFLRGSLEAAAIKRYTFCQTIENLTNKLLEAKAEPYDFVIVDQDTATEEHAIQVIRDIRQYESLCRIKIILLDRKASLMGSLPVGVDACLAKPMRSSVFIRTLKEFIEDENKKNYNARSKNTQLLEGQSDTKGDHDESFMPNGCLVLIADDNRTNRMVAARMFASSGCQCEFAVNGKEALEAAKKKKYDLILMDCSMPEMDGYEATQYIRILEKETNYHTLIIALTANTQPGDKEKCLEAGMDDYMSKPLTLESVKEKLVKWIGKQSTLTEHINEEIKNKERDFIEHVFFNTMWQSVGDVLDHSAYGFFEDMQESIQRLEELIQKEDEKALQEIIRLNKKGHEDSAISLLERATECLPDKNKINEYSNLNDLKILMPPLRHAFEEISLVLRKN